MLGVGGIPEDVVDLMAVGVWIARAPSGELVFANQVFREIMGMDARNDVAAGGYAAPYGIHNLAGEPYPEGQLPFARALRERAIVKMEDIVIHRPDDTRVNIRATGRPWFNEAGEVELVVVSFEDITAEIDARHARLLSEERLRQGQRLEALGTLAAGIAHDFNNVLASINMIAAEMRLRDPHASNVADLRQIEAAVDSAAQLTRALLAFGRAGSGRVVRFDLASTIRGVLELARRTFDRNVEVDVDIRSSGILKGDPGQIDQLCLNLIVNARDAMPEGGTMRIEVDALDLASPPIPLTPGRHLVLTVSDTGPGIPPELRHRIFEPYFTTKGGSDRPGTGLGLATVYAVAQGFGGMVELADAEPHGAVFKVTLPLQNLSRPDVPIVRPTDVREGRATVLVVDDEELVRRATRRSLERLGYTVLEARDGMEALETFAAEQARIDVVLLDAVMPRLDGPRAMSHMRRLAPELPIIVTSGRIGPEEERSMIDAGATALLAKPYTVAQLSDAIAAVTERRA